MNRRYIYNLITAGIIFVMLAIGLIDRGFLDKTI